MSASAIRSIERRFVAHVVVAASTLASMTVLLLSALPTLFQSSG
jgi:hypothetical protein